MDIHHLAGDRIRKLIGAGLTASAVALAAPAGFVAADPGSAPGLTDPVMNDYLERVTALVEQFNGEDPSGRISAEDFNSMLNAENGRLLDALIAAELPQ